jgi:hypothetical protein
MQLITEWQLAPVFKYAYMFTVCHVKSVRNTGLRYLQKLMWFVVKAQVFLEPTKIISFFVSSNCGFQFYCEPMFCVVIVIDCNL